MTPRPLVQVDAFTDVAFAGNPAAVCVGEGPRDEAWMQAVAVEMNLSETAFLHPVGQAWALRWFTPGGEVDLCGHATLAAAHVLWAEGHLDPVATARFATASGELTATRGPDGITLDFPATPPWFAGEGAVAPAIPARLVASGGDERSPLPPATVAELLDALGLAGRGDVTVGRTRFDAFVVVEDLAALLGLAPDHGRLARVDLRGAIVTAAGGCEPDVDLTSRFFAPALGIPEDPVTGSAHCALGPFWAARLGKRRLVAHQASPRGGRLTVEPVGDRVRLTGRAVTVLRGDLLS